MHMHMRKPRIVGFLARTIITTSILLPSLALGEGALNEPVAKALEQAAPASQGAPATIFIARKIVTMEPKHSSGEAVAILGKRILAVGALDEVKTELGDRAYRIDETFKSKIVMPGFIDQHLHPILGALTLAVEVIAPEDWNLPGKTSKAASNEAEYRARLKAAEARLKDPNEWLITWGYHSLWHGKLLNRGRKVYH